ncbi:MAG: Fe-S cluster assembly protein SufD [Micrococcales bacterium]|nr:Fe-S cluster assembly protein SufD [Micrococcales bacterium]
MDDGGAHLENQARHVTIPAGVELTTPVRLAIVGMSGSVAESRHVLRAMAGSKGMIVLDHRGSGTLEQTVEIEVGDGAQLTVIAVHDGERDAVHTASHQARVSRDATLRHTVVSFGGAQVSITPTVVFCGPGGDAELLGLNLTDTGQKHEARIAIDHAAPRCRSRVTYKGALSGAGAHSVWVGDVLIRKNAEGTDTYELNRHLMLTRGARVDSVPNLEIETGQIEGAGHASATGRFDGEQLFYLRSRGIDEASARRLVVRGFFAELLDKIPVPDLAKRLADQVDARLAGEGRHRPALSVTKKESHA